MECDSFAGFNGDRRPFDLPEIRVRARTLRDTAAPPERWFVEKPCMGKPGSVRADAHAAKPSVVGRD